MALTAKQEVFAQAIADGMTQADAYRTAYDASRMKDSSIHVNASKLLSDAKVSQRVAELKAHLSTKALWTREMSVKALVQAYKEGGAGAKVSAVKELNLMHGYNAPVKLEHTGANGEPIKIQLSDLTDEQLLRIALDK